MTTLGALIAFVVEERFLDRSFVATPQWRDLGSRLGSLPTTDPAFRERAQAILDELPLSHVQLLSPEHVADAENRASGDVPEVLRMSSRRGEGWFYLRLPSFAIPAFTVAEFAGALSGVRANDVLVLDLRLNAGGSLSCAGEALAALVGGGVPYARTDLGSAGEAREVRPFPESANPDHEADVAAIEAGPTLWLTPEPAVRVSNPLVLLVDRRCYSAGEVFAQALVECGRGTLLGARTAGAVVAAKEHDLVDGWQLTLPFAHLRSGEGTELEGNGVAPDIPRTFDSADTAPLTDDEITTILDAARRRGQARHVEDASSCARARYGDVLRRLGD